MPETAGDKLTPVIFFSTENHSTEKKKFNFKLMFSESQYSSSEPQQYDYFVMQEPVFEEKIEEPVYLHVYEENGVLYCACTTSEGLYWYTYALNNPLIYTDPSGYMYDPTEHEPKGPLLIRGQKPIYQKSWRGDPGGQFAGCGFDWGSLASAYNNSMSYRPPEAGYGWEFYNPDVTGNGDHVYRDDIEFTAVPVFTSGKGLDTRLVQIMYFEGNNYFASDYFNSVSNDGSVGYEDDVSGVGISIEFAVPRWLILRKRDYSGVGIDVGILRDSKGLGFYATTKTTMKSGIAATIQLEGFGAIQKSGLSPINRTYLHGPGYETGLGLGPVGGQYSTDNSSLYGETPSWHMMTFSIGLGLDVGFVNWNTNTYVSGRRKF